jgi:hypothetical protein
MCAGTLGKPLQVHNKSNDTLVTIPAKYVCTPHKTLGHYKASAGANQTQLRILRTNLDGYAKLIATSPCNRMDSCFFYTAIYLKSLGYVFADCFFTEKYLANVQSAALQSFLAKSGYNRNTHRAIIFAPISHGGCGFISLFLIQGEGQVLHCSIPRELADGHRI